MVGVGGTEAPLPQAPSKAAMMMSSSVINFFITYPKFGIARLYYLDIKFPATGGGGRWR